MTFDFPKADWLPLAKAVFDVHQSDSWKDATSEELLNSLLFRVTVDFPDVEAELSDRSIIISRRGESGGQSWSEEIGTYTLGQPFEYHEYLQQTPPDEFRKQAETVIRTFLARLDQVFRKQHSRGRFSLYAE